MEFLMNATEYREGWRIAWRTMRVTRSIWLSNPSFGRKRGNNCVVKWLDALAIGLMRDLHLKNVDKREIFLIAFCVHNKRSKRIFKLHQTSFRHHLAVRRHLTLLDKKKKIRTINEEIDILTGRLWERNSI